VRENEEEGDSGEIELFGEDTDRVQVTYFNVGEHCPTPRQTKGVLRL
jgi:hypothetical protein